MDSKFALMKGMKPVSVNWQSMQQMTVSYINMPRGLAMTGNGGANWGRTMTLRTRRYNA